MMITSTADFEGRHRAISIGFDSDDARKELGEAWDQKTFRAQIDWLSKKADIEVLRYAYQEGFITEAFLRQRVGEIKAR